jgi:hypothetical protein
MNKIKDLQKLIRMTGERAKLDAKANDSYVVYKNETGLMVKEYANGTKVTIGNYEEQRNND